MSGIDLSIYAVHVAFWSAFGLTRAILRAHGAAELPSSAPVVEQATTAPFSRVLLGVHLLAFGVMYFGLAQAVLPDRVPAWFPGQRLVGAVVIATGAALMAWALVYFRSWRFRAKVDQGHQLATGGPFRLMRHPIYMGLNLLALGTAVWVPTVIVWIAFVLMIFGSDLRACAEEKLLEHTLGEPYTTYAARTRRFVPGIY